MVWCICRDVTERKASEKQIFRLAHFDSLTGLPNRSTLVGRVQNALDMARRDHKQAALLFLDLDRFKLINDTRGHLAGDELLKAVGRRLKAAVREVDTICRLGGDEFVVALVNLNSVKDVSALAAKLLKPLARHFDIEGQELFVTASMGISMFPQDGEDPETLLSFSRGCSPRSPTRGRSPRGTTGGTPTARVADAAKRSPPRPMRSRRS